MKNGEETKRKAAAAHLVEEFRVVPELEWISLATSLRDFYRACLTQGFTPNQALSLTNNLMNNMINAGKGSATRNEY